MTPHVIHANADILANLITDHFLNHTGKRNHEYKATGSVEQIIQIEGWDPPQQFHNWTYQFWHTYRPTCVHQSCAECPPQLRGVLSITTDTNAEYRYEVTDDFCERYMTWAILGSIA